jgi:TrpR family transcriptional regulator, trp operon repressor
LIEKRKKSTSVPKLLAYIGLVSEDNITMPNSGSSNRYFTELVTFIHQIPDQKTLTKFMRAILTVKERDEIPKRLQIIKMLKRGVPQRKIAEKLGVGIATVTRGSKELHEGNFNEVE